MNAACSEVGDDESSDGGGVEVLRLCLKETNLALDVIQCVIMSQLKELLWKTEFSECLWYNVEI